MIAVDTNILLRYLLQDDESQAERANAVFTGSETILITDVVLVETVWTLVGRKYRLPKENLIAVMERLFSEPYVRFEDDQVVWRALQAYRNTTPTSVGGLEKEIGLADTLIVFKALQVASNANETLRAVYTFDAALQKLPPAVSP